MNDMIQSGETALTVIPATAPPADPPATGGDDGWQATEGAA